MKKNGITLPMSMLEIAETIGFDSAVVLMDNFGGIVALEKHKIARLIGLENYKKLCKNFGGQRLFIPRGAYRRLKKSLIIEADGNISNRQLCRILGVTERYVLKVKAELKEDKKQGELF